MEKLKAELKRENENVIASLMLGDNELVLASEPMTSLLLNNERIIIKNPKQEPKASYKRPTDTTLEYLKQLKINSKGISLNYENFKEKCGKTATAEKIAKQFKKNKNFVADAIIDEPGNTITILVTGKYYRTLEHELEATRKVLALSIGEVDIDLETENQAINEVVHTFAIRHYNSDFHAAWSWIYDKMNALQGIDIREEFEKANSTKKYNARIDFVLAEHRALFIKALSYLVIELKG